MEREVFKRVKELVNELTVPELTKLHNILHELGLFSDVVPPDAGEKVAQDLIKIMNSACGVDITSPSRRMYVRLCRWCVIEDLLELKYSLTSIGRILNKHHSTIHYTAERIRHIQTHQSMYPDYYEIKEKYQIQKDKYGYNSLQDLRKGPDVSVWKQVRTEEVGDSVSQDFGQEPAAEKPVELQRAETA